jgi:hypothetical protein
VSKKIHGNIEPAISIGGQRRQEVLAAFGTPELKWSNHALLMMEERKITVANVEAAIRLGYVELDVAHPSHVIFTTSLYRVVIDHHTHQLVVTVMPTNPTRVANHIANLTDKLKNKGKGKKPPKWLQREQEDDGYAD